MDPVEQAWRDCAQRRPDVAVSLGAFRARVPDELAFADDVYLVAGCLAGDPAAIAAFERELVPVIDLALRSWDRAVVDEARQQLRATLLVGEAARGPILAKYSGRGPLSRWLRVVAAREAARLHGRDRANMVSADDQMFDALVPAGDPALSAVKEDGARALRSAFAQVLGELERKERTLLRMHFLDGLTVDEIAPMYGAHRATVARWITAARQDVLARTRRALMKELRLDAREVDSLIDLVKSRIDLAADALDSQG